MLKGKDKKYPENYWICNKLWMRSNTATRIKHVAVYNIYLSSVMRTTLLAFLAILGVTVPVNFWHIQKNCLKHIQFGKLTEIDVSEKPDNILC